MIMCTEYLIRALLQMKNYIIIIMHTWKDMSLTQPPFPEAFPHHIRKFVSHTCSWATQYTHWQTKPLWGSKDA